ncbi:MAG: TlpA family protein disulfide reductase [Clostridia bacterium]|nr:TlpA family protein disulfide reductase [Clostridia bacterium]
MNKFRKILLGLLISCFAVCLCVGVVACTKRTDYPDYTNTGVGDAYKDRYVVSVKSAGGLPLNDVRISAKKDGITRMSGVSVNGKIEFTLPADEYELVIDETSLPLGYYLDADTVYKTTKENARVDVSILSTVIHSTAPSGTKYSLGDIMYNFGFTDTAGVKHTLEDVLATKKAVMLNFWYTSCGPCRNEFPAVQAAYEAFADKLSIIALSGTDTMEGDNGIIKFREDNGLSFYMGQDQAGLINLFNVEGYPTTVIVDRYGVIVHRESGGKFNESYWRALFATYTSDDYTPNPGDGNDIGNEVEFAKPDSFDQPTTEEFLAAIGGEGASGKVTNFTPTTNEIDAPYSFPWLIGEDADGKYIYASNSKVTYSFATLIFDVTLQNGDVLIWDYKISTEENDVLYIYVNNTNLGSYSGTGGGWQTEYAYIASREVKLTITLLYLKDLKDNDPVDLVCLKNIRIANVTDLDLGSDQQISVTDGLTLTSNSYNISKRLIAPTGVNGDIYYHFEFVDDDGTTKKALLLADILRSTAWSDKFVGDSTFYVPDQAQNYTSSLYLISYWTMSNYKLISDDVNLLFSYTSDAAANIAHTDTIVEKYYLQEFSDNGLVPVTEKLKNAIMAFTKAYCDKNNKTYYEDQWLELCYYYRHYGDEHLVGNCSMTADPVKALVWENAFTATTGKNEVKITKIIQRDGGGLCYTFTPQTSGVYHFYSTFKDLVDPCIYIYTADNFERPYAHQNDDNSYDFFTRPNYEYWNFNLYVPLKAGETYYVRAAMGSPGSVGEYNMFIEYDAKSVSNLVVASYDGTWTELTKYNAIPVALSSSDGYFHAINANNDYGSVVYIDFVHPNFFDLNDNSLLDLIKAGRFDFRSRGGQDYSMAMRQYYYKSIANKNNGDELYGLIEADYELVNMISELIYYTYGDGIESGAWLMFGCYYETIVCNYD